MDNLIDFLIEIGGLKGKKRRGWMLHQIKNSESTAEHTFRVAIMAWVLGKRKKLDLERVLKIALIHDLCEVYSPDLTPYDPLLPKDQKKIKEILKSWPKFTLAQKKKRGIKKYEQELKGLEKLIDKLPFDLKAEIKLLWLDLEKGLTKEGKFVKQVDKLENLLQGLEYWEKYGKIKHKLWMRWIKEVIDDPILIEFIGALDRRVYKKK